MLQRRIVLYSLLTASIFLLAAAPCHGAGKKSYFRDIAVETTENVEDVVCIFCSIHIKGQAAVAVTVMGGVEVSGTVKGAVVACGGGLKLNPGAKAEGSLVVLGGPLENLAGANLTEKPTVLQWIHFPGQRQVFWRGALALTGYSLALALLSYILLRKRHTENVSATIRKRKLVTLFLGLITVVLTLVAIIYAEDFGDWEDAILYAALAILPLICLPGIAGMALVVGASLTRGRFQAFAASLVGAIALAVPMLVPLAGIAFFLLAMCLSAGGTLLSRLGGRAPA